MDGRDDRTAPRGDAHLLAGHDGYWEGQKLAKGWWNDGSDPALQARRREVYGEVYAAVCALRSFKNPGARDALELTRRRWAAVGFENRQIVEECEAALSELAATK